MPSKCVIAGTGSVTLPPAGFAYLTRALQQPPPSPNTAPPGTELEVFAQQGGTVTFALDSVTLTSDPGSVIALLQDNSRPELRGCVPVDGQANAVQCPLVVSETEEGFPRLFFSVGSASSSIRGAYLGSHETALLIGPPPAAGSGSALPVLTAVGRSDGAAALSWDGVDLLISAGDGYLVDVSPSDGCESGVPPPPALSRSFTAPSLFPLCTVRCGPVTGGTVSLTLTPPGSLQYPGSALLTPGGAVSFHPPPQNRPPGTPPPSYGPTSLLVVSNSDQPASLAFDGKTLAMSIPAGFSVELLGQRAGPANCTVLDAPADSASCFVPAFGIGSEEIALSTVPTGSPPELPLPRHTEAWLSVPAADSAAVGKSVSIGNSGEEPATASWDGSTLSVFGAVQIRIAGV